MSAHFTIPGHVICDVVEMGIGLRLSLHMQNVGCALPLVAVNTIAAGRFWYWDRNAALLLSQPRFSLVMAGTRACTLTLLVSGGQTSRRHFARWPTRSLTLLVTGQTSPLKLFGAIPRSYVGVAFILPDKCVQQLT